MSTQEMKLYQFGAVETTGQFTEASWRSVGSTVLHFAERALSFGPTSAPDYLSQHFGHAERRNDPRPDVVYFKT